MGGVGVGVWGVGGVLSVGLGGWGVGMWGFGVRDVGWGTYVIEACVVDEGWEFIVGGRVVGGRCGHRHCLHLFFCWSWSCGGDWCV